MSQIRVTIEADVNDGDYIHNTFDIDEDEFDEFLPVINTLKGMGRQNYEELRDMVNGFEESEHSEEFKDLFEEFKDYLPCMDNQEIHTIESISYCPVPVEEYELL